jgi:hypothetical protein
MFEIEYTTTDGKKAVERHELAEVSAQGLYTRDGKVQEFTPWHIIGSKVAIVELDEKGDPVPEPRKPETSAAPGRLPGRRPR